MKNVGLFVLGGAALVSVLLILATGSDDSIAFPKPESRDAQVQNSASGREPSIVADQNVQEIPPAVIAARNWYSKQVNLPLEKLEIASVTKAAWEDSCLGIYDLAVTDNPTECKPGPVEGYSILFRWTGAFIYIDEVHVDVHGTIMRTLGTIRSVRP